MGRKVHDLIVRPDPDPLDRGLELEWRLDDAQRGHILRDSSGNKRHGRSNATPSGLFKTGSSWITTNKGIALHCPEDASAYTDVTIQSLGAIDLWTAITLECYYQVVTLHGSWPTTGCLGYDATVSGSTYANGYLHRGNASTRQYIMVAGATRYVFTGTKLKPEEGDYIHVITSYDGTTLRGFREGVPDGSIAASGALNDSEYGPSAFFLNRTYSSEAHELIVFNARVYNRALTEAQARERFRIVSHSRMRPIIDLRSIGIVAGPPSFLSISESDGVTVGDTATITPLLLADISETDGVTVGDTATLRLPLDLPSQQDDITVGDTATLSPVSPTEVSEADGVTVGDTATLDALLVRFSASDAVTVGDAATLYIGLEVAESEGVAVGDTATLSPVAPTDISESEAVTVGDTPTVDLPVVGDKDVSEQEDVTVGDTATLSPVSPTEISETEDVTVGDTATLEALAIDISETESVTAGDTASLAPVYPTEISELDAIAVGEADTVQIPVEGEWDIPAQEDAVTVGESVAVTSEDLSVSVSDGVAVGDTAQIAALLMGVISVLDAITVADTGTVRPLLMQVSESEAVTVAEVAPTLTLSFIQTLVQAAGIISAEAFETNHVIANVVPSVPGAEDTPKGMDHDSWIQY